MIDYGGPPQSDEAEISLFGPGFGEAIAVHLAEQAWLLIDSCIDPVSQRPATLHYLESIGVPPRAVRAIVASHWHDDHVRGLGELLGACAAAELQVPAVFSNKEALAFLATYSGAQAPLLTRGTKELYESFRQRTTVPFVKQRSDVIDLNFPSVGQVRVSALSPTHAACASTLARMASYVPTPTGESPIEHAPDLAPNEEAVVIHIDWAKHAVLLGSDLEGTRSLGWQGVVSDSWCTSRRRACVYKVAHHGSKSGDHPAIWSTLLEPKPHVALTPFNLGKHRLPTEQDRKRIKAAAGSAHITSKATRKPDLSHDQIKRLSQMCTDVSRVSPGFGAVRFRRATGASVWSVEHFGDASEL